MASSKTGIDQDALIEMFAQAGGRQGESLRQAVGNATLRALQGRELTLQNIRGVLKSVTQAASTGAAQNPGKPQQVEAMLSRALEGMDAALLQAVEANRRALQQFVDQGVGMQQAQMQAALGGLEKLEDTFFATVSKAAQAAGPLQGPWLQALEAMKLKGSDSGAQAAETVEQMMARAHGSLREGRAIGMKAARAMMDNYAALVSGVLIGMSEGLRQGGTAPAGEGAAAASGTTRSKR